MELKPDHFWVVDVEGNGATPPEIVELAMVEVKGLRLTGESKRWLVRPATPISSLASGIHGIRNKDVEACPAFSAIASEVRAVLESGTIVGHNVRVEVDVLTRQLPGWQPAMAIDTLKLAKNTRPGLESYALSKLGGVLALAEEAAKLTGKKSHSALYDATLAALVFSRLLSEVPASRLQSTFLSADIFDEPQGSLL